MVVESKNEVLINNTGVCSRTTIHEVNTGSNEDTLTISFTGSQEPTVITNNGGEWGPRIKLTINGHIEIEEFLEAFKELLKNRKDKQ